MQDLSAERAARNESVFRDANERIEERLEDLSLADGRSPFLCECDNPVCTRAVRLTVAEYEAVREHPDHFVLAPEHQIEHADVVSRHDRFQVIQKRGREAAMAVELDPRQREPS